MKARLFTTTASIAILGLILTGCGAQQESPRSGTNTDSYSVVNVFSGPLGDQGFFDDAARGMKLIEQDGNTIKNIEGKKEDPAQWKSNIESVSTGQFDIVITGTSFMTDILTQTARKHPEQKYITYDDVVKEPNVASITYKQNEGAFLAGVLAALVTSDPESFPRASGSKTVGMVGAVDVPIIRDFLVGFTEGVHAVDPSIRVLDSFVGDYADSNKGYDQAQAMFNQNADVIFQVAGGSGLGVLKAANDSGRYAIGVDANQNSFHQGAILASMVKNIGESLRTAVAESQKGSLAYGKTTEYGLANGGVGLIFEDNGDIVSAEIQKRIAEFADRVISGEITVSSTL
ncbi:BMP family ABC transporter substrate-binding protein [Lysinibacter sp. HNR]|uniref:BMP family lipoprotein n=1 Tax=Lysinibacter sp. HNR TaxID=3031408 RepID=UPI00243518ED|nr:BMP family ABC transporter substrate-binding protein [Lysinibacter sp. HNR]WGD38270.1 BMP family ABC transporter substrate-binding protein [Lysinibacter sp. HNR]